MASPTQATADENKVARDKMDKAAEALRKELAGLRTGRASLALLDNIRVEYYGSHLPLNQVATLAVPEARMITIQAWDKKAVPFIEKAIINSNLGLVPTTDGQIMRVSIPPLTQERRQDFVKLAHKHAEECRVSMRNARRDAKEALEKRKKDGKLPEDDLRRFLNELQKLTDDEIHKVDETLKSKEKEILET
ncbi:MAG: ribosome recycling factor [Nitrospirae bacterium]|nr:ribosome recycling factor [Nitrospirota bacterium]